MLYLVYREDIHGNRVLVRHGLDTAQSSDLVASMEAGGHHQSYWTLGYDDGGLDDTLRMNGIRP